MALVTDLVWHEEVRRLGDLREWVANPRYLTTEAAGHIKESLTRFNLAAPLIINTDNVIIGGHQRRRVMLASGEWTLESQVAVRVPNRRLSCREVEELNIRLNRVTGEWDWEMLGNRFEVGDLLEWGFTMSDVGFYEPAVETAQMTEERLAQAEEGHEHRWDGASKYFRSEREAVCPECGHIFEVAL